MEIFLYFNQKFYDKVSRTISKVVISSYSDRIPVMVTMESEHSGKRKSFPLTSQSHTDRGIVGIYYNDVMNVYLFILFKVNVQN